MLKVPFYSLYLFYYEWNNHILVLVEFKPIQCQFWLERRIGFNSAFIIKSHAWKKIFFLSAPIQNKFLKRPAFWYICWKTISNTGKPWLLKRLSVQCITFRGFKTLLGHSKNIKIDVTTMGQCIFPMMS